MSPAQKIGNSLLAAFTLYRLYLIWSGDSGDIPDPKVTADLLAHHLDGCATPVDEANVLPSGSYGAVDILTSETEMSDDEPHTPSWEGASEGKGPEKTGD